MKIIFTRNNLPFSKFLCWGLREPVSHMAIVFDNKLVFHSNFKGLHVEWFNTFLKGSEVVYEIELNTNLEEEEQAYQQIITQYDGASYDYSALLYLAYRSILNRFFKVPLPSKNVLAANNKYLCIEVLALFPQIELNVNLDNTTPYKVYLLLKEKYG